MDKWIDGQIDPFVHLFPRAVHELPIHNTTSKLMLMECAHACLLELFCTPLEARGNVQCMVSGGFKCKVEFCNHSFGKTQRASLERANASISEK